MKTILFAMLLAFGTTACAKEEPKKAAPATAVTAPAATASTPAAPETKKEKETRKVCVDVKKDGKTVIDPKTGKPQQRCMNVKVHEKLDNPTKVPAK